MEASCNCKAVHVAVRDDQLFTKPRGHICHCLNCRRTSGSAFGTNLAIEADKVTITGQDNLTVYPDKDSLSGNVVRRFFCKTCGSPIKSETDAASKNGMVILKLGIFEKIPQPELECFVEHRLGWVGKQEGTSQFKLARGGEKVVE